MRQRKDEKKREAERIEKREAEREKRQKQQLFQTLFHPSKEDQFEYRLPHEIRVARHKHRNLLLTAGVEANLAQKGENSEFAWFKLYSQREGYLRSIHRKNMAIGGSFTKLFDIRLHLSTPQGDVFEDVQPTFPLRPVVTRRYWMPRRVPTQIPWAATDGSIPVGGVALSEHPELSRWQSVSHRLFARRFPLESRFVLGPSQAFILFRTTSIDGVTSAADVTVPDKPIRGKKFSTKAKNRNASPKPSSAKKSKVDDDYDYDDVGDNDSVIDASDASSVASSSSSHTKQKKKKKSKQAVYTPYVELDDPTLPTPEDIAAQKKAEWTQSYLRGDTLYNWLDAESLTESLSSHLYFDEATGINTSTFHSDRFVDTPASFATSDHSIYFDQLPTDPRAPTPDSFDIHSPQSQNLSLYFEDSFPLTSSAHFLDASSWAGNLNDSSSEIFFSESSLSRSTNIEFDIESLISEDDSIYYDPEQPIPIDKKVDPTPETSPDSPHSVTDNSLYFDAIDISMTSPLAQTLSYCVEESNLADYPRSTQFIDFIQ